MLSACNFKLKAMMSDQVQLAEKSKQSLAHQLVIDKHNARFQVIILLVIYASICNNDVKKISKLKPHCFDYFQLRIFGIPLKKFKLSRTYF